MASNSQKTPFVESLNDFAQSRAQQAINLTGKVLPCSVVAVMGQIVKVSFEVKSDVFTIPQVTIPIATSAYDWIPVQVGDKGYAAAADVYLGGVSGLGGGTASLTQRGNLTALVFVPISNKAWTVANVNQRVIQAPAGVLLQTKDGAISINLTTGGVAVKGNVTITGNLTATGSITAGQGTGDQVSVQTHKHGTGTPPATGTVPPTPGT